jgi:hypothetical protein
MRNAYKLRESLRCGIERGDAEAQAGQQKEGGGFSN